MLNFHDFVNKIDLILIVNLFDFVFNLLKKYDACVILGYRVELKKANC